MREVTTEELKAIQIDILDEVHAYCVQNEIPYSLSYGTLLGAVRHKGYIPWDDDIDIMIPRKYYNYFIQHYKGNNTKVISFETHSDYYLPFAKVYNPKTLVVEKVVCKPCYGVNIDVFPIDAMPSSVTEIKTLAAKKQQWNKILLIKNGKFTRPYPILKLVIARIYQCILKIIPTRVVLKKLDSFSRTYEGTDCPMAGIFAPTDNKVKWIVAKEVFEAFTELAFEGKMYHAVSQFDKYLAAIYGDYMRLPPVEQRVTHHGFVAYWKD